jgi:hypothetical protein
MRKIVSMLAIRITGKQLRAGFKPGQSGNPSH